MDTACPAREALPLHCTHWLSPGLPTPLYHSPINLSLPRAFVSHIHPCFLLPCWRTAQKVSRFILYYQDKWLNQFLPHPFLNIAVPHPPTWVSLARRPAWSFSIFLYSWILPLAVLLPVESGSLPALPSCPQAALSSHKTVALRPGSRFGSRAEKPLLSPKVKRDIFDNRPE